MCYSSAFIGREYCFYNLFSGHEMKLKRIAIWLGIPKWRFYWLNDLEAKIYVRSVFNLKGGGGGDLVVFCQDVSIWLDWYENVV